MSAAAYTPESAGEAIRNRHADAVAFGRLFIANPDLVQRIKQGHPLTVPNRATFYGGGAHGYTDYEPFRSDRSAEPIRQEAHAVKLSGGL